MTDRDAECGLRRRSRSRPISHAVSVTFYQSRPISHSSVARRIAASRAPSSGRGSPPVSSPACAISPALTAAAARAPLEPRRATAAGIGSPTSAASTRSAKRSGLRQASGDRAAPAGPRRRAPAASSDQVCMTRREQREVPAAAGSLSRLRQRLDRERVQRSAPARRSAPPACALPPPPASSRRMASAAGVGIVVQRDRSPAARARARRTRAAPRTCARARLHEPARELLPYALRHQRVGLAVLRHLAHQLHRLRRDREARSAPRSAPRAGCAPGPRRRRGLTWRSTPASRSRAPLNGSMMRPSVVLRDRVDGEVAPREVLLRASRRARRGTRSRVAARGLALGARERVLLVGLRVQEHRKVPADRLVARLTISSGVAPTTT